MTTSKNTISPSLETIIPHEIFKSEVLYWSEKIGVQVNSVTIRPMSHKWASCSSKGNLSFDISLLTQPAAVRKKVIIHELLHLRYPNHGKMFKALEKKYMVDE